MTIIKVFENDGSSGAVASASTDYVHSLYQAKSDKEVTDAQVARDMLRVAKENNDDEMIKDATEMLKETRTLRSVPPKALTNNRELVVKAIECNKHKRKYASGVISHAHEDTLKLLDNPAIMEEFRECFELLIFAGIDDDMLIEWVEHRDKGNIENHFIVPRIHLPTGKYFNPAPPAHVYDFRVLCEYLNTKHELRSPIDIEHRKLVNVSNTSRKELINVFDVYTRSAIRDFEVKNRDELLAHF
ncbi:relaxase/mobilization nuclease domain-containing protein, partial [Vibrio breoganii]|uniref:relaxase/mobilization nuclease domain-containing protein n=1 Tax=Vibrio breoganii TaxID=553239 RepID=UPI0013000E41